MTPKPCPFCGMLMADWSITVGSGPDDPLYFVECDNCSARGPLLQPGIDTDGNYTKAEAIRAWNTRSVE